MKFWFSKKKVHKLNKAAVVFKLKDIKVLRINPNEIFHFSKPQL